MKKYYFIFVALIFLHIPLTAQTHTWTGNGGNTNWFNAGNWDVGTVPVASSEALISGEVTVTVADGPAAVASVEILSGATLILNNNFTFSQQLIIDPQTTLLFQKGILSGGGTIYNQGMFHLISMEDKDINNINLENNATVLIENVSVVHLINTIVINNYEGAEISILSNGGFIEQNFEDVTLNNYGLLKKLPFPGGNAGTFYLICDINNYGIIDVGENQTFLILGGSQNFVNADEGTLQGNGAFDITSNFTNTGTLKPGNPLETGSLEIVNNADLLHPGKLEMDINGPEDYDVVTVFGTPDLEGGILVNLGYGAELGDEFTILTASNGINSCDFPPTVTAEFGPFDIYTFDVICNANSIVLKVEAILLGVDPFETIASDFFVYPNPVKEIATINWSLQDDISFNNNPLSVSVYNLLGQEVKVLQNFSKENNSFDRETLAPGLYILHLKADGNPLANTKMVLE